MHDGAGVKVVVRGKKLIVGSEVVKAAIWTTMDDKESGPGDKRLLCRKIARSIR